MTVDEVRDSIVKIYAIRDDGEAARSLEDDLHQGVLRYIAAEAPEPFKSVARVALETCDIEFSRWCA